MSHHKKIYFSNKRYPNEVHKLYSNNIEYEKPAFLENFLCQQHLRS